MIAVLAGILAGCGGGGGGGGGGSAGTLPTPVYTPASPGTPTGTLVTQTIDANGGSVASADGRLALTIPAGALSAATDITIQPITNTGPNGEGLAYRLLPDGTTFAVPVTLNFNLSDTETAGIDHDFIATQHADGLWYVLSGLQRDAASKTLSVTTTHFTDYADLNTLEIRPALQHVQVNHSADFEAWVMVCPGNDPCNDDTLTGPGGTEIPASDPVPFSSGYWSVDGVQGGDATHGMVGWANSLGHYAAPGSVPNPSTVSVSLTYQYATGEKFIAAAQAQIEDKERWDGFSDITLLDGTKVHATFTMVQNAETIGNGSDVITLGVESGDVTIIPPLTVNDCPLDVSPVTHAIAPDEGSMTVEYTAEGGPDKPLVSGGGTTVWLATYTVSCPNQDPYPFQAGVAAEWWPVPQGGPTAEVAENGSLVLSPSSGTASGSVTLTRQ